MRFRAHASVVLAGVLLAGCASPRQQSTTDPNAFSELTTAVPATPVFPVGGPVEMPTTAPPPAAVPHPGTPANRPNETWVPLQRWARENGFGSLTRAATAPFPVFEVQSTNGAFALHPGSQLGRWDGMEVRLGFAPQMIDGQPYVHTLDLTKTIQPLLKEEPWICPGANPVIVIDPGHGGENAGTKSVLGNHYEKEFTLDWALRLQALLEARHCKTFLTRSNDTDLALSNRVAFAAQHHADLFLSLHFNSAAPNETEAGLETYCLTPAGMPSNLTRGFSDEIHQTFPNNAFDPQNLLLALRVHRALLQVNGHHDRGIRRARFLGILRGQPEPAVLVEGGYLSNPQEAHLIEEPAYRQRLAEALVQALVLKSSSMAFLPGHELEAQNNAKKADPGKGPAAPIQSAQDFTDTVTNAQPEQAHPRAAPAP